MILWRPQSVTRLEVKFRALSLVRCEFDPWGVRAFGLPESAKGVRDLVSVLLDAGCNLGLLEAGWIYQRAIECRPSFCAWFLVDTQNWLCSSLNWHLFCLNTTHVVCSKAVVLMQAYIWLEGHRSGFLNWVCWADRWSNLLKKNIAGVQARNLKWHIQLSIVTAVTCSS